MKELQPLAIIGAGGLGREVAWLINDINKERPTWDLVGFFDDGQKGHTVEGYPIIGKVDDVMGLNPSPAVVIAIADSGIRNRIFEQLSSREIKFATLIHPSVVMSEYVRVGEGSIICAGTVITTNVKLGNACIVNLNCSIGHDTVLSDFVSLMPGANVAGEVCVGKGTYFGLNSAVINRNTIGEWTTIGAGAVVITDIPDRVTAVGVPARVIKGQEARS